MQSWNEILGFQSLLSQGISLLATASGKWKLQCRFVSIPS